MLSTLTAPWRHLAPSLLSLLRVIAAFLFIQAGTAKLLALPGAVMPGGGVVPLMTQAGMAGLIEIVGGTLMFAGLFTRPVAFVLAGEMAFAYFIGHAPMGFWPILNMGTDAIFFCFLWLYISAAGPGPWSLDAIRGRRPLRA